MAGGDFHLDFAAAAPYTYDHLLGGGTWEDKTIGRGKDVVEQLESGDFRSGDIVSYFLEVDVDASATEPNQAIQIKLGFLASTTGQAGVGHDWIENISVNYYSERVDYTDVPPPAGSLGGLHNRRELIDTANNASRNDGGSYAVLVEQGFETRDNIIKTGTDSNPAISTNFGPLSNVNYGNYDTGNTTNWLYDEQGTRLYTIFNLYDLDAGEKPVVRIDVHLGDDGKSPTGNLQGFLLDSQVISATNGTTKVNTGRQTVPLKLTKDLTLEPPSFGIAMEKFVTTDIAGFNALLGNLNDSDSNTFFDNNRNKEATIFAGQEVVYLYKITNTGTATIADINLWDDADVGADTITNEVFIPRPNDDKKTNNQFPYLNSVGTLVATVAEAAKILADQGGQTPFGDDEIQVLKPKNNAPYENLTTGVSYLLNQSSNASLGVGGANDLAPGKSIIMAYRTTLTTAETVNNEAVAAYNADANGGGQQGDYFGVVDSAVVHVLPQTTGLAGFVYYDSDPTDAFGRLQADGSFEEGIGGVTLTLSNGTNTYTTITNSKGEYRFENVVPSANYTLTETQPGSYLDGGDQLVGTATGTLGNDVVTNIDLSGTNTFKRDYNFGEIRPAIISGMAYYDLTDNNLRDPNETGRPNIVITLTGNDYLENPVSLQTITDKSGRYSFEGLLPSNGSGYTVTGDTGSVENVGTIDGVTEGNSAVDSNPIISSINIGPGDLGIDYDFGVNPSTNSISGTVYQDTNDNGSFERTGSRDTFLQFVTITLNGTRADNGKTIFRTATTDAQGNYTFNNLPNGTYTVTEIQPQYFDPNLNEGAGGFVDFISSNNTEEVDNLIENLVLSGGTHLTDNDFGELPPASISGYVYADIDPDGNGTATRNGGFDDRDIRIEGVTITLYDSSNNVVATTTTNANGYYQFVGLEPDTYRVEETQPNGYLTDGEDIGSVDGLSRGTNASQSDNQITAITLAAGDGGVEYNFREVAQGAIIEGYVYQDDNNDGVFDSNEAAISEELAISSVTIQLLDSQNQVVATTTTNEQGKYSFTKIMLDGTYTIQEIQPTIYNDGKDSFDNGTTNDVKNLGGGDTDRLTVTVDTGNQTIYKDYNFGEIQKLGSISGNVSENNDYGLDGSTNLANVTVELLGPLGNVLETTLTDTDGNYSFTDLPAGDYYVRQINLAGYDDVSDIDGGDDLSKIGIINLSAGENSTGNDFVDGQFGSISGNIFEDTNNNGVYDSGTESLIDDQVIRVELWQNGNFVKALTTSDGTYEFTKVPFGSDYEVRQFNQPVGYDDGQDSINNSPIAGSNLTDEITGLSVSAGTPNLVNNNFGEIVPSSTKNLINGTDSRDFLNGTPGDDLFFGGKGADVLNRTDSAGADCFLYTFSSQGMDYIFNFAVGDEIVVTEIFTEEFGLTGPDGFTTNDPTGYYGFSTSGSDSYINLYADGLGGAGFAAKPIARLMGVTADKLQFVDNGTDYVVSRSA